MIEVKLRHGPEEGLFALEDDTKWISMPSFNYPTNKIYIYFYEVTARQVWSDSAGKFVQSAEFRDELTKEMDGWAI